MNSRKLPRGVSYHKSSGLYIGRYYITLPDGTKKRQAVYGKTPTETRKKLVEAERNSVQTGYLTVGQHLTTWLQNARGIRKSTRENYGGEIRKHIIPYIGNLKLSTLTCKNIQDMMTKLIDAGVSTRTTHILKSILSRAFKAAEAQNLIKPGIIHYVELDPYTPKEREIWNEQEGQIFIDAIKGHKYQLFFALYMTYGLRRGEAIPLTWGDVDFQNKTIRIDKQYTYQGRELVICPPKTKNGIRTLPLLPHIECLLLGLKGSQIPSKDSLIISVDGNPVKPSSIQYEFEQIIKTNHLRKVTLHSLRHFVATQLKDIAVKDVQEILGHSSPSTTIQFYQHSDIESKRNALTMYTEKIQF